MSRLNTEKYSILTQDDFDAIAKNSKYQSSYIRQVLRGNSGETKFNSEIYEKADQLLNEKIDKLQKGQL